MVAKAPFTITPDYPTWRIQVELKKVVGPPRPADASSAPISTRRLRSFTLLPKGKAGESRQNMSGQFRMCNHLSPGTRLIHAERAEVSRWRTAPRAPVRLNAALR